MERPTGISKLSGPKEMHQILANIINKLIWANYKNSVIPASNCSNFVYWTGWSLKEKGRDKLIEAPKCSLSGLLNTVKSKMILNNWQTDAQKSYNKRVV